jgi:hypothetical protein
LLGDESLFSRSLWILDTQSGSSTHVLLAGDNAFDPVLIPSAGSILLPQARLLPSGVGPVTVIDAEQDNIVAERDFPNSAWGFIAGADGNCYGVSRVPDGGMEVYRVGVEAWDLELIGSFALASQGFEMRSMIQPFGRVLVAGLSSPRALIALDLDTYAELARHTFDYHNSTYASFYSQEALDLVVPAYVAYVPSIDKIIVGHFPNSSLSPYKNGLISVHNPETLALESWVKDVSGDFAIRGSKLYGRNSTTGGFLTINDLSQPGFPLLASIDLEAIR